MEKNTIQTIVIVLIILAFISIFIAYKSGNRNGFLIGAIVAIIAVILNLWLLISPKYQFVKQPVQPYQGSKNYGGGNVEEQLAFVTGYKTYMQNPYS